MSEVNRIIQDLEFCDSEFDCTLTPDDSGLLLGYIQELQQENQQLKDVNSFSKRELYKINKDRLDANLKLVKENKKLKEQYCERTDCVGRLGSSRKVERYKSVLDEMEETIKHYSSYKTDSGLLEYCVNDLLQILDKVKEW